MTETDNRYQAGENDIAIVGMAAHLPGAGTIAEYWDNLRRGISSIRRLSKDELIAAGENPALIARPDYVPYSAPLEGFERFDAEFFGLSPKEAAIMDPQHRQFLETAWEALENAGHMPENFPGPIGVYAGCGMGSYFYFNLCTNRDLVDSVGLFLMRHTGNDKDFLSTRLSHIFDLRGPSVSVQTACSTSLVAVHYATQALLNGECDMALAGGVTIEIPQMRGYVYKEGEVLSPDGECHAFDHRAQGTVFGSGAGVVVLRRAADAIEDNDHIWAIIRGTAVNNDGADKAGYLAPSVGGQSAAIAEALAVADVPADTVDYVECHGTGTYLGDPIEVAALTDAFRKTTNETGFCRIGSVKTNIGHLDTAAGVASLIKASLSLHNRQIPPSLGYDKPNPAIDFETSPFRVNDRLTGWTSHKGPRRATVNSLGVGGTNAHVVLEEAPAQAASEESDWPFQLLTLSARSRAALDGNARSLAAHLKVHPEQDLADVAFTLQAGRRSFEKRRVVVAENHDEAARLLEENNPRRVFTHALVGDRPEIAFMFPGGGAQYAGMARDLYETEPVFAEWMDRGLEILQPRLDYDIRALWLPESETAKAQAEERLRKPSVQLPLIMIVEFALAQLWMSWGITPKALIGHSMGENTAACLAGVMSFEDCIGLVHLRGQLFDTVPAGGMLSVTLPAGELEPLLEGKLDIAAVNAPGLSVATGPDDLLDDLQNRLVADGIDCQRIPINIAAHSRMLEPILGRFTEYLRSIPLSPPRIPFVSNRTGKWITETEATNPDYWVRHLRQTVHFADGIATLAEHSERILLEVGPGKALSSLAQAHPAVDPNQVIGTLRHPNDPVADDVYFMTALGRLWAVGVKIDWSQIWGEARRNRVLLPSYAFQRSPYYIEPGEMLAASPGLPMRIEDRDEWFFAPRWRPAYADCALDVKTELDAAEANSWLIFTDDTGLGRAAAERLRAAGKQVICVRAGDVFAHEAPGEYVVAPERGREDYDQLVQSLMAEGHAPDRIAHFWLVTHGESFRPGSSFFHRNQEQGFYSLLFLAQALSDENLPKPLHLTVFSTGALQVRGEVLPHPDKATVTGPVRVIPRELPGVSCALVDLDMPAAQGKMRGENLPVEAVLEEMLANPVNQIAAQRGGKRFVLGFEQKKPKPTEEITIREGGTYMITGGFGGIGLTIAADLIREYGARIVLVSRSDLPPREQWPGFPASSQTGRRIRAVQALEALGGEVLTLGADVCNVEDMREAAETARSRFGAINGVVHAAGVISDAPLLTKTVADVEDVFSPKVHGLQVLDQVFPDGSLDWLVLFSSTSTVTAPAGQIDYVAANEYLNAWAKARAGGKTRVVAIDWGIWADTGMAADAIAAREGGKGDGPAEPVAGPLLDAALLDGHGDRVFTSQLSTRDWVIGEHRLADGSALLPGTGYLELAAEALRAQGETGGFEIRDLYFLRPLAVPEDGVRDMRVRLARSDEGYMLDIRGDTVFDGRPGHVLNAQARLALGGLPAPATIDTGKIRARCAETRDAGGGTLASPQEAHLNFGPRWQVLKRVAFGNGEGIADLALPPEAQGDLGEGFLLHPALMDIATGWAMELIEGYRGQNLWVPVSYGLVRVLGRLPAEITSWVRLSNATGPMATFDITLVGADGEVCVEIEGFAVKRIEAGAHLALNALPSRREVEFTGPDPEGQRPLSPAEERLRHNLSQGIPAADGARAFRTALAAGAAQVVVSSLDLHALVAQTEAEADDASAEGQKFERPELDSDYIAPETEIERTLAGFWEELLGVAHIGVEDSFFDLGGHSLIAVRLFAMIKKAFRADFPISVLFEAPTIRKIASLVEERVGPAEENGERPLRDATPRRRFTHLVPMHQGEGGSRQPFFLVAGMFGNVLNLRHLAHLLGADRPFYGLQACGLYGGEEPHKRIDEAAAAYIAEMRQVQPEGPYMLGGFSGGGITAYEIARQLEAAGEEVSLVIMLDTPLPQRRPLSGQDRVLIQLAELRRNGPGYLAKWAVNRVKWELHKRRAAPEESTPAHQFHNAAIEAAFYEAVAHYQVAPWSGNLVLFRPPLKGHWQVSGGRWVDRDRAYVFEDNDWTQFAPGLRVIEVPGDHDSMVLEPNVRVLAGRMKRMIEEAETTNGGGLWPDADPLMQAAE
jgi:acyl transferase domain-containing protein/thioesterase domain-containing protein